MKCFNILKITQLQLYLLVWCQASEILTLRLTDLGQNVTINCDLDVQEVDWLLLKLPDPPVLILHPSTASAAFHYSKMFKQKYSVQSKHHLFINNVTVDDLGLYYCVTTDSPPKYSDGTKLHITEPTPNPEIQNHRVVNHRVEQNQSHQQIIVLISAFINALLIIVIIGLLKCFARGNNRTRNNLKQFQDVNLQQLQVQDPEQPQDSTLTKICYRKI